MGKSEKKRSSWRRRLGFVLYLFLALFVLSEIGVRFLCDEVGGYTVFRDLKLVPFDPMPEELRAHLSRDVAELPYLVPDPELGWTIRPGGASRDGLFHANAAGLRSAPRELVTPKPVGVRRILLAGDSYTHGDEVAWPETWAAKLETQLGAGFEVWNGAVPGYGTDQAVMRMQRLAPKVAPDLVILGIYWQDLLRNLTLFRVVKHPFTQLPWSKPRFVLDGPALRLVNSPVVPPDQVETTLRGYEDDPLSAHDTLHVPAFYRDRFWYRSRLVRLLASKWIHRSRHEQRQELLRDRNEGVLVAARLAKLCADSAAGRKARTLCVLLPAHDGLPGYAAGKTPRLGALAAELTRLGFDHVDVGKPLLASLRGGEDSGALYVGGTGHPNGRANEVIARELAVRVRELLP